MAREGIAALFCATVLFTPLVPYLAAEPERDIATTLAVQQALKEGREAVKGGQYETAVRVLELQLSKINGNKEYLACLRDAYRGYVKELLQAGPSQAGKTQDYLRRLEILDPGARRELGDAPVVTAPPLQPAKAPDPPAPDPTPAQLAATPGTEGEKNPSTVLGKLDGLDGPFAESNRRIHAAADLLGSAHQTFLKKDYAEAGRLYEQAHKAEPATVLNQPQRDEWAYCKLAAVREQCRQSGIPPLDHLEDEVKAAIALSERYAPNGQQFLKELQTYRSRGIAGVRHLEKPINGWAVAESNYFRIFHKNDRELAEKVARVAEQTRQDMDHKWFAEETRWRAPCDLYIHPTALDYSRATGKPENWNAHSTINMDGKGVTLRRIDLRADDLDLLTISLPHETTHAVLAGHFGANQVPRWADEGMALLSEPSARLEQYRLKLDEARRNNLILNVRDLMTMNRYPEQPAQQCAFYVQSVSLTDYLVKQTGGAQAFTRFVNEGLRSGYDTALLKVYGLDMGTLDKRWRAEMLGGPTQAAFRGADR